MRLHKFYPYFAKLFIEFVGRDFCHDCIHQPPYTHNMLNVLSNSNKIVLFILEDMKIYIKLYFKSNAIAHVRRTFPLSQTKFKNKRLFLNPMQYFSLRLRTEMRKCMR